MNNPSAQVVTFSFTTNREIRHWVDRDDSVILKGYVDAISPLRQRGYVTLFQIIVNNNNGSRVTVIFLVVLGWLKLPFADMNNGGLRYGSGLIVDGNYKIKVHVNPFVQNQGSIEGIYVRVVGNFVEIKMVFLSYPWTTFRM
ncbi:hypothetical protein KQX54_001855 [Cotesia glomerata]|uniref:Uncharacterized protein n=1 Tax=Cotesia glomerata TaxID=32391 RepID=A0AAV7IVU7_COTGL|nr:hypothetical protein KQX54_001855 [Cotesia glomerata]